MTVPRSPLGFTPAWFALGLVTPEQLAAHEEEWARGEDPHPKHYRWRAFQAFLRARRPLTPSRAQSLYELGAEEADRALGESMMHALVALPECPGEVLELARRSGRAHLVKAAQRGDPEAAI